MTISARAAIFGAALLVGPVPAIAVPLLPGETLTFSDYLDAAVAPGDPDWFGTPLLAGSASAVETRDGFAPPDVVEDLFTFEGLIDVAVERSVTGRTVFGYRIAGRNGSLIAGGGLLGFAVSGFAGYSVDFAPFGDEDPLLFIAPDISRSADGDVLTFLFTFEGGLPLGFSEVLQDLSVETFLFATDAPEVRTNGGGSLEFTHPEFGSIDVVVPSVLPAPAPIPLPAGLSLLVGGLGALALLRRRARGRTS